MRRRENGSNTLDCTRWEIIKVRRMHASADWATPDARIVPDFVITIAEIEPGAEDALEHVGEVRWQGVAIGVYAVQMSIVGDEEACRLVWTAARECEAEVHRDLKRGEVVGMRRAGAGRARVRQNRVRLLAGNVSGDATLNGNLAECGAHHGCPKIIIDVGERQSWRSVCICGRHRDGSTLAQAGQARVKV